MGSASFRGLACPFLPRSPGLCPGAADYRRAAPTGTQGHRTPDGRLRPMVGTATRKRLGRRGERRSVRASAWGAAGATPALALAIAAAGGAAALIVLRHPGWAGALTLAGGAALLAGWWLTDQIPQRDPRARFAAMLADPIFDVCLLASIAWAARHTSARVSVLALVALGLSYLASYMRARADSLSYR